MNVLLRFEDEIDSRGCMGSIANVLSNLTKNKPNEQLW